MVCRWSWLPFCSLLLAACGAAAYDVPIADTDYDRQICSGMWAGKNTYINGAHTLASLRVRSTLIQPHRIIDTYGYCEADIVLMIDAPEHPSKLRPTKQNIVGIDTRAVHAVV